jgi:hypothetical protein
MTALNSNTCILFPEPANARGSMLRVAGHGADARGSMQRAAGRNAQGTQNFALAMERIR